MKLRLSPQPYLAFSVLALALSCGQKTEIQGGYASAAGKRASSDGGASGNAPSQAAEAPQESSSAAESSPEGNSATLPSSPVAAPSIVDSLPETGDVGPELTPEAVAPVSVAGAHLFCQISNEADTLGCFLEDDTGKILSLANIQTTWTLLPNAGAAEINASFVRKETASAGTYFFVATKGVKQGLIKLVVPGVEESFTFELSPLFANGPEIVRLASQANLPGFPSLNVPLFTGSPFGDGILSNENDSCLGAANRAGPRSAITLVAQSGVLNPAVNGFVKDVCGLQTRDTSIRMTGPAPFKPIRIFLLPETPNMLIFRNVDLAVGTWRWALELGQDSMPGGGIDDFSLSGMVFSANSGLNSLSFSTE